jgi:ParB family chromosome partitioning protein
MRTQANTKQGGDRSGNADALRMIALKLIDPPPTNTRTIFKKDSLAELTLSVKQNGIIQPILVRPVGKRFQIVAGERRFKAANQAGLKEIPASVKNLSDEEALDAQLIENLQREDVHPLEEAEGFLRMKNVSKLEIPEIAQRVAKDQRYVARRLALTDLIEEAREDFRNDLITLAHALEICVLSPNLQPFALAACYERNSVWSQKEQTYTHRPDKEKPARHVKFLQAWIEQNIHLNLKKAPFRLDDTRLREDGLTCIECPQRSGFNKTLFADIKNADTCLNPMCFQAKIQTLVQVTMAEIKKKSGKPAAYVSPCYSPNRAKGSIGKSDYQQIERRADRCEFAEQAVYAEGEEVGRVIWICRERTCKDHMGRVGASHSSSTASTSSSNSQGGDSPEKRNKRKQEIFDIKVDEIVRKRVMKEALETYKWPLERAHLNEVVKEFFRRIASDDQRTICEVFGWSDDLASKLRYDQPAVLREIAKLDDSRLSQFMMLCSFAHYGANQYKHNQVDQKPVVQLSRERKVNHALIDAQVRVELCAKKYKATHQAYLDAVTEGKAAKKPVVFEQQPPQKGKAETVKKAKPKSAARFKSAKANAGKRKTGASDARV